jgi:hypothetical protein
MPLPRALKILAPIVLVCAVGAAGYRIYRGPIGATTDYGGSIASQVVPDFPSADPSRWVNGAPSPLTGLRGQVVLVEAWGPA